MMYKCNVCGCVFEDPTEWKEDRGEYWGVPCTENCSGCPKCHGDYEEVFECDICGKYHTEDKMYGQICENCVESFKYDIETCYEVGATCKEKVELNGFLAAMFTVDEIEMMLYHELERADVDVDCSDFIDNDRPWFAESLSNIKRGNEK